MRVPLDRSADALNQLEQCFKKNAAEGSEVKPIWVTSFQALDRRNLLPQSAGMRWLRLTMQRFRPFCAGRPLRQRCLNLETRLLTPSILELLETLDPQQPVDATSTARKPKFTTVLMT